jgi:hypothetical protein
MNKYNEIKRILERHKGKDNPVTSGYIRDRLSI